MRKRGVSASVRFWANELGGNAVFEDLKPGDRFHFPRTPGNRYEKLKGGWFRAILAGHPGKARYRTGPLTAVVKLER